MSRGGFKVNRQADVTESEGNLSGWLKEFAKKQDGQGTAVDAARARNAQSFLNQIVSIMGNPPRYATVDDAVKDMRERTGLNTYLEKIKSAEASEDSKKKVNKLAAGLPESLAKYTNVAEDIENFVRNNIRNGHSLSATVPQLQHDILAIFGVRNGIEPHDVMNDEVAKYLSDIILSERSLTAPDEHNPNIGYGVGRTDIDDYDNQDAFEGLMPAR
jgi:hypothetical protein